MDKAIVGAIIGLFCGALIGSVFGSLTDSIPLWWEGIVGGAGIGGIVGMMIAARISD